VKRRVGETREITTGRRRRHRCEEVIAFVEGTIGAGETTDVETRDVSASQLLVVCRLVEEGLWTVLLAVDREEDLWAEHASETAGGPTRRRREAGGLQEGVLLGGTAGDSEVTTTRRVQQELLVVVLHRRVASGVSLCCRCYLVFWRWRTCSVVLSGSATTAAIAHRRCPPPPSALFLPMM
jgi:hypothetical protein